MRIWIILLSTVCVLLAGCASDDSFRRYDNPRIRKLQEEETARHVSDDITKAGMARHIGERVSLIFVDTTKEAASFSGDLPPGGRAAALTSDGYFLTAHHVVKSAPFYIEKSKMIRKPPASFRTADINLYFSKNRYYGRLVWSAPSLDLAILKFAGTNWAHFDDLKILQQRGDTVFTADDQGRSFIPADEEGKTSSKDAVGNGRFFAAREILRTAILDPKSKGLKLSTTLAARGGMSGAPLVTSNYELCGIISRVEGLGHFHTSRTIANMIAPETIFEIVESDRIEQGSKTPKQTTH